MKGPILNRAAPQKPAPKPKREGPKREGVVAYGAVVRAWTQFTGLALFALGARMLGVADFGVFALAVAFVNIVQIFIYSGVYEFVMKSRPKDGLDHTALALNFAVSCTGALGNVLLGWLISLGAHQPAVFQLALTLAPSALIAGVAAWHEAQVLRAKRYDIYYANWALTETIAAAAGVALLFLHARLYSLVGYRYLQSSLTLAGYLVFFPVAYRGGVRRDQAMTILRFAGPIYGSRLLSALSNYGVDLVVGLLMGPAATGLYRMSSRIVSSVTEALFQPLRVLAWIRAAKARGVEARVCLALLPLNKLAALVLWPGAVVLAFIAGDILSLGLGPRWAAATPIIATLLLARSLGVAEIFLEPLLATTRSGRRLLAIRIAAIAAMFATLLALARFGPAWSGLANLASAVVILAAVAPRVIRAAGARRVLASARDGAVLAIGAALIFLAADAVAATGRLSLLAAHAAAAILAGLLVLILILRRLPAFLSLRRSKV